VAVFFRQQPGGPKRISQWVSRRRVSRIVCGGRKGLRKRLRPPCPRPSAIGPALVRTHGHHHPARSKSRTRGSRQRKASRASIVSLMGERRRTLRRPWDGKWRGHHVPTLIWVIRLTSPACQSDLLIRSACTSGIRPLPFWWSGFAPSKRPDLPRKGTSGSHLAAPAAQPREARRWRGEVTLRLAATAGTVFNAAESRSPALARLTKPQARRRR